MASAISSVETFVVSLPYDHGDEGLQLGGQAWSSVETLLVRLVDEDGVEGWGEGFGFHLCRITQQALDRLVAPLILGQAPESPAAWTDLARRKLHNFGMNGPVMFACSAVDIALWDMAAKRAGQPLRQLIGARGDRVSAYASLMRFGSAAKLRAGVQGALAAGYRAIKLHEVRAEEILAARQVMTEGQSLMVDVNCAWSVDQAIDIAKQVAGADLTWLEEPTWPPNDYAKMARVRRRGGVAIAAGENLSGLGDFKNLFAAGAVDYAQASVTKVGGVTELLRVAALCDEHGVKLAPHSPYLGPGYLATAQVLATLEHDTPIERFYGSLRADFYGDRFKPIEGHIDLGEAPGLGADPNMVVVERCRVA